MLDVIIIGGGPAGLAAAIYLARQKLKFTMLVKELGGYALWSEDVENYLGFHLLSGSDLVKKFKDHLRDYSDFFELHEGELASKVEKTDSGFRVQTEKGSYEARTILITTGTKHRQLNVPGEKELYGKGVTYCATCDAPLFKDKKVYVIGGGNSSMNAALLLEKYASEIVIVSLNSELNGDSLLKSKILASQTIKVYPSTKTSKIEGKYFVEKIGLVGEDGQERLESAQGVFIEIGLQPASGFIDLVEKDKGGQIIVDKKNRTSQHGIFAAGDVTDISEKQIAIAVGEGSKAALEIISFLQQNG